MRNLNFNNGLVSYEVNGVPDAIRFCPTDAGFIDQMILFVEEYGKKNDKIVNGLKDMEPRKVFDAMKAFDSDIRQHINTMFGEGTADKVFQNVGLCAMADGLPVWLNFCLAILEEVEGKCTEQQHEIPPRLQKIMAKYKK